MLIVDVVVIVVCVCLDLCVVLVGCEWCIFGSVR